jgi:hypothetical protein
MTSRQTGRKSTFAVGFNHVRFIGLFSPLRPSTPNISAEQDIPPPTGHLFRLEHFFLPTICLVRKMNLEKFTFGAIFDSFQLQHSRQSQVFVFELVVYRCNQVVRLAAFS